MIAWKMGIPARFMAVNGTRIQTALGIMAGDAVYGALPIILAALVIISTPASPAVRTAASILLRDRLLTFWIRADVLCQEVWHGVIDETLQSLG
jgi:hypothetical protein